MSVFTKPTRRNIPKDGILYIEHTCDWVLLCLLAVPTHVAPMNCVYHIPLEVIVSIFTVEH
jgi:hypothetical protein